MNAHNKAHNRWVDEREENIENDFIARMYKIMNTQSKALNQQTEEGVDFVDKHGYTKEREGCDGVSFGDFKKTMIPWLRKFCELKDNDNL